MRVSSAGPELDAKAFAIDLAELRSEFLRTRPTSSHSNGATQTFLARRFSELGLRPYDSHYRGRFSFHKSR